MRRLALAAGVVDQGHRDQLESAAVHRPGHGVTDGDLAGRQLGVPEPLREHVHAAAPRERDDGRGGDRGHRQQGRQELGRRPGARHGDRGDGTRGGGDRGDGCGQGLPAGQRRGHDDDERELEGHPRRAGRDDPQGGGHAGDAERGDQQGEVEPSAGSRHAATGVRPQPHRDRRRAGEHRGREDVRADDDKPRAPLQDGGDDDADGQVQGSEGGEHPGDTEVGDALGVPVGDGLLAHVSHVGSSGARLTRPDPSQPSAGA